MTDGYILFVKLSNFLTSHSQTKASTVLNCHVRTFPTEVLVTRQNTFDVVKMSSLKWAAHVCFFIQIQTSNGPKMFHSQILKGKQIQILYVYM